MWHKKFHRTLLVFNIIMIGAAILWFIDKPDYEPFIVLTGFLAGISTLFHTNPTRKRKNIQPKVDGTEIKNHEVDAKKNYT